MWIKENNIENNISWPTNQEKLKFRKFWEEYTPPLKGLFDTLSRSSEVIDSRLDNLFKRVIW